LQKSAELSALRFLGLWAQPTLSARLGYTAKTAARHPKTAGPLLESAPFAEGQMRMHFLRFLVAATAIGFATSLPAAETNWPQFRGNRSAVAEGVKIPDTWSITQNVAWKTEVAGRGWSSPVVWGDKIFVTAVVREGNNKLPRKGLYIADVVGKTPSGVHEWKVYCLDIGTGKILWEKTAHKGKAPGAVHVKNSFATETPVTDGKRLYVSFGNLGLFCYDLAGKQLWSRPYSSHKTRYGWGPAASPVLHKDRVYVVNDNEEKSFLAAIAAVTGKEIWRVPRPEKSNWATPLIWENALRTEIVTAGSDKVRSYSLDGKPLWELGGMSSIAIPTPSAAHGLLYVSSGYIGDFLHRPVFAIKPGATGDISLAAGETKNNFIVWCQKMAGPYNPSPVVLGDYLYVLYDKGLLACYEAKTGKLVYKRKRLEGANAFTASPVAANGKLYCLSEDGDTYVIQAGPEFKVLAKNRLDEMSLATPALVGDSLLIRTASKVYRIRK
jgi:outer membrane protein assembly factor BamB